MAQIKSELGLLKLVIKVINADIEFFSVHFEKVSARFGHRAKEVMEALLSMRGDVNKAQKKEVMERFIAQLPAADPAALLADKLIAQQSEALSSPKDDKSRRRGAGAGDEDRSFWDIFKGKDKKDKKKPKKKVEENESQSIADFLS